jgi:hypothetical protein
MAEITDHIDFQTILQTAVAPRQTFGIQLLLVDDPQIPIDQRIRYTSPTAWDTEYTSGSIPYDYANVFFGQALKPESLMFGRWIQGASNPYFVCGSGYEKSYAAWAAVTDAEFAVTDGTNTDNIGPLTFAGVTALDQILPILNAGLAAVAVPTVTGLNTFQFVLDSTGRLVLNSSQSGASADTIAIVAHTSPTGTEISVTLMDAGNGTQVAGFDAEEPEEALQAISAIDDSYYNIHIRGRGFSQGDTPTEQQKEDLAIYVETQEKLLDLVTKDADCLLPTSTDDLAYNLFNINIKRSLVIWHRDEEAYPDAAAAGRFLPETEGTFSIEWQDLALITDSGDGTPLTLSERTALKDKNCSHIERVAPITFLYNGLTSGGIEKRIMLGRDWFVARNREDIFTYQIQSKLAAFDNITLTAIEEIIRKHGNEAIDRRIIVDTPERPFTVTLPDADDIDQATRATHELVVLDAFQGYLNSAIHDYRIVGTWTL